MQYYLKNKIKNAKYLVIGAGSGLSTAAGFIYDGKKFYDNFKYMEDLYGYHDMYTASFHDFSSDEAFYGYFSKFIYLNRYETGALPLYQKLVNFLKDKNYFVITTNVDHQFQKAGINKEKLFYTQGDYGLFQCPTPCHKKTYDNKDVILKMIDNQIDHKVPSYLLPRCPICKKVMIPSLRGGSYFVEDRGWYDAKNKYIKFLNDAKDNETVFLELGVGYNTPGIIKYPFMEMTKNFKDAIYICVNKDESYIDDDIKDKSYFIKDDLNNFIDELVK